MLFIITQNCLRFICFFFFTELEAKEACDWLRAAGFPQYAQLYEGKSLNLPSCLVSLTCQISSFVYSCLCFSLSESLLVLFFICVSVSPLSFLHLFIPIFWAAVVYFQASVPVQRERVMGKALVSLLGLSQLLFLFFPPPFSLSSAHFFSVTPPGKACILLLPCSVCFYFPHLPSCSPSTFLEKLQAFTHVMITGSCRGTNRKWPSNLRSSS